MTDETKIINGKKYTLATAIDHKLSAHDLAADERKKGYSARVLRDTKYDMWNVWIRPKKSKQSGLKKSSSSFPSNLL